MTPLLAAAALKIAVLGIEASGVDPALAKNLSEVLADAVAETRVGQVLGQSDLAAMLGFEQKRQLLACGSESSCLAEIGGALGVDKIVVGVLGQVEQTFILSVRLIDIKKAKVEARVSEDVEGKAAPLIAAIRRRVPELMAVLGPAPPADLPPQVWTPAPKESRGKAVLRGFGWTGVVLGLVGTAAGGLLYVVEQDRRDRYRRAVTPEDIAEQWKTVETFHRASNTAFFAGGGLVALGVTGVVVGW